MTPRERRDLRRTADPAALLSDLYVTTKALTVGLAAVGAVVATRDPQAERLALALAALQWRPVPCVFTGHRAAIWAALMSLVELGARLPKARRAYALDVVVEEVGGRRALLELDRVRGGVAWLVAAGKR